jgi:hypothetical protein
MLLAGHTAQGAESSVSPDVAGNLGHVRSESPVIASVIQDAAVRSATFRTLLAAIDASDSYVFVRPGLCSHGVRACFTGVRSAGSYRFMFVTIDPSRHGVDLMVSLSHELRHTIEVISDPSVRSTAEKFFFYQRTAFRSAGGSRETLAAQDTGNAVRSEIEKFNRQSKLE